MRNTILCIVLLLLVSCGSKKTNVDFNRYEKSEFESSTGAMPYRILLPENYDENKKYPLVFVLHGAGERGTDNEAQLTHGADLFLKTEIRQKFPAIVVFPQCPEDSYWSNVEKSGSMMFSEFTFKNGGEPTTAMESLQKLLGNIIENHNVDKNKVYVGGLSMGGMGTFEIVARNPETFAAAFAICGGAHQDTASKLTNQPWWVFHGDSDMIVDYEHSENIVKAMKDAGADVKFTTYEGVNHDSWNNAFADPELVSWLFSHSK